MQYVVQVMETVRHQGKRKPGDENETRVFKVGSIETDDANKAKAFANANTFGDWHTVTLCRIYVGNRSVLLSETDMQTIAQEYQEHFA